MLTARFSFARSATTTSIISSHQLIIRLPRVKPTEETKCAKSVKDKNAPHIAWIVSNFCATDAVLQSTTREPEWSIDYRCQESHQNSLDLTAKLKAAAQSTSLIIHKVAVERTQLIQRQNSSCMRASQSLWHLPMLNPLTSRLFKLRTASSSLQTISNSLKQIITVRK